MVGISTCGTPAIGNKTYATNPTRVRPIINKVVAIGRTIKGAEIFIATVLTGSAARFRRLIDHVDRTSGLVAILPVDDDLLAGVKAIVDNSGGLVEGPNLDRAFLHDMIGADHENV